MDLKKKANELRLDILKAVYQSKAGHIGGDLSIIDILTVLYYKEMNISAENFHSNRHDYFILSKGHTADALYAVLTDKGFADKEEYLNTFSAFGSKFIGHPNTDVNGVEINSGSLGHGLSVAVGIALANKMDNTTNRVYVALGDGEMAEGSNYEAMMAAGHYQLNNLCAIVDVNGLQISGTTKEVMDSSDLSEKFKAFKFNVIELSDGHDIGQITDAFVQARKCLDKPSVIIAHTVKGKGISFMENVASWHHGVLSEEQYLQAVREIKENM